MDETVVITNNTIREILKHYNTVLGENHTNEIKQYLITKHEESKFINNITNIKCDQHINGYYSVIDISFVIDGINCSLYYNGNIDNDGDTIIKIGNMYEYSEFIDNIIDSEIIKERKLGKLAIKYDLTCQMFINLVISTINDIRYDRSIHRILRN